MSTESDAVLERALTLGWTSFKRSWPLLLVASLAVSVSGIPGGFVSQIGQLVGSVLQVSGGSKETALVVTLSAMALGWACSALVQWPVTAGAQIAAVRAQRGHRNDFGAILAGFRRFVPVIGANIIMSVAMLVALAPGVWAFRSVLLEVVVNGTRGLPSFSNLRPVEVVVGGLVSGLASILLGARLMLVSMRAADPDLPRVGAIEAIRFSIERTRGNTLNAIGMLILTSTVSFLSILLCCIGVVLVGMPLAFALQAGFYRALLREADPIEPPPPEAWPGPLPPQTPV
jgi:uncharacterized membrane protein